MNRCAGRRSASTLTPSRRVLLSVSMLLAACNVQASPDWVPGTYVLHGGRAADTLLVRRNHTFERRYRMPGTATVVDHGAWSLDTLQGDRYVTFSPFVSRGESAPSLGDTTPQSGFWPVMPERTVTGVIVLPVDPDLGWEYRKVSPVY